MDETRQQHWNAIYKSRDEWDVSWFEAFPAISLEMIEAIGLKPDTCIVDVGGGESRLIDALLKAGLNCLAVLDVSREALEHARARIGTAARVVTWIESDVTGSWSLKPMDIWHDRAVFHFLVEAEDRLRYLTHLRQTLKVNGGAIIATFAPDGPDRCSGLPVARYSPDALAAELGGEFTLLESRLHPHRTPSGTVQSFQYSRFRRSH